MIYSVLTLKCAITILIATEKLVEGYRANWCEAIYGCMVALSGEVKPNGIFYLCTNRFFYLCALMTLNITGTSRGSL